MGRKIPGKKHRGVKDPEKQRRNRFQSIKDKINTPPTNPDVQEVPKSVTRIAELKEKLKQKNVTSIKIRKKPRKDGMFQQKPGESDREFLYRINKMCETLFKEKAFENKYNVDITRNENTGEVVDVVKRKKDELEEFAAQNKKQKKGKKKTNKPTLTKSQKRQLKLKERKEKKLLAQDIEVTRDEVKFGEIVHAPPTLSFPRKAAKLDGAPRPGQKNLLLKSIIDAPKTNKTTKVATKVIDKTGKRKNLPNALRRRLEKQQQEIIDAYRMLKSKNKN